MGVMALPEVTHGNGRLRSYLCHLFDLIGKGRVVTIDIEAPLK